MLTIVARGSAPYGLAYGQGFDHAAFCAVLKVSGQGTPRIDFDGLRRVEQGTGFQKRI